MCEIIDLCGRRSSNEDFYFLSRYSRNYIRPGTMFMLVLEYTLYIQDVWHPFTTMKVCRIKQYWYSSTIHSQYVSTVLWREYNVLQYSYCTKVSCRMCEGQSCACGAVPAKDILHQRSHSSVWRPFSVHRGPHLPSGHTDMSRNQNFGKSASITWKQ